MQHGERSRSSCLGGHESERIIPAGNSNISQFQNVNHFRKEEDPMERYEKPVMILEEIEDEVYTIDNGVAGSYRTTVTSEEFGRTNNKTPVGTYVP